MKKRNRSHIGVIRIDVFEEDVVQVTTTDAFGNVTHCYVLRTRAQRTWINVDVENDFDDDFMVDIDEIRESDD